MTKLLLRRWFQLRTIFLRSALAAAFVSLAANAAAASTNSVAEKFSIENLNSNSAATFADSEFPSLMRRGKIPGAVFVVVKDEQVICEKAYGVENLQTKQPVSVDQTLFRVASISKIFTAASALELVHQHLLGLHQNVNRYLTAFHIANAFGRPVTLFNLLTHSSGFDDCQFDYAARSPKQKLSLRDYLALHQPARVRPPGLFSVYDNYGFALAGYLVQRASGISFAHYEEKQILEPLDMERSSFAPDAALQKNLATGYWLDRETPRVCGGSYINIIPAAGLCVTASDMSRFMAALLTDRQPDGEKIFPASVIAGLETQQFAASPEVPGRCFGFNEILLAGRRALRQTGQWPGFNSVLLLFPKQHCSVFIAYNLCDYLRMEQQISRQFVEKFIPPDLASGEFGKKLDSPAEDSFAPLLGAYLSSRSPHDAPEFGEPREMDVTASQDGTLEINGQPYREIEPLVFQKNQTGNSASFGARVAFESGQDGEITHLVTQSNTYRRVNWMESMSGGTILLQSVSIIFLSALILWPIMALVRFAFSNVSRTPAGQWNRKSENFSKAARGMAFIACALALWFELSFALAMADLKPFADFYGFPASLKNLLWLLPVLTILAVPLIFFAVAVWRKRLWHPLQRLHYTLIVAALMLFLYIFYSRHLLFIG